VESFRDDLLALLENRPVSAQLASRWYLLRKMVSRHKLAAAAIGAAVGLIIAATVVSTVLAVHLDQKQRQATAVAKFLQQTLSAARPGRGGAGVTVLEVIATAERRADVELADQPEVAIEVYQAIGETYRSLWKFGLAIAPLEKAEVCARAAYGDRSETVARLLSTLGHCFANTNDARAVEVQGEALAIRTHNHRGDHSSVAESHMRLGYALYRAAEPPDRASAEQHLSEAVAMYKRLGDSLGAAQALHNLGYFCWASQRTLEAVKMYEEAMKLMDDSGAGLDSGDASHAYVECLTGYAALLMKVDRVADCVNAYERLIPVLRRDFPEDALPSALRRVAQAYQMLDESARAVAPLEELLAIQIRLKGEGYAEVASIRDQIRRLQKIQPLHR
jgi:serine/threonine-protein kinase